MVIWIDTCSVLRLDCALFWPEINIFKWTWNKLYLTQTSFLLIHCFPIGLPYRSVHSAYFGSTLSVRVKSFSYWRQKLFVRPLSDLLEFIVEKISHGFGQCESKLWAVLVCRHCFPPLLLLPLYLEQCLFQADQQLLWLGCDGRAVKPKCCFPSLPSIFVYLLCLLLFSHNLVKKFTTSQISLLCQELTKSWYQSYKVRVQQWGKSNQNHILMFSRHKINEKQKIQVYGWITDFRLVFLTVSLMKSFSC